MNSIPKLNLFGHVDMLKHTSQIAMPSFQSSQVGHVEGGSFKTVFSDVVNNLNNQIEKPDAMLADLMSGKSNVDIHDVMIAISKAELGVTLASQVTTKVIQSYERISQIQV